MLNDQDQKQEEDNSSETFVQISAEIFVDDNRVSLIWGDYRL